MSAKHKIYNAVSAAPLSKLSGNEFYQVPTHRQVNSCMRSDTVMLLRKFVCQDQKLMAVKRGGGFYA